MNRQRGFSLVEMMIALISTAAFGRVHHVVREDDELFDEIAPIARAQPVQFGASGADAGRDAGQKFGDRRLNDRWCRLCA